MTITGLMVVFLGGGWGGGQTLGCGDLAVSAGAWNSEVAVVMDVKDPGTTVDRNSF